ncbi:MAG: amidohydrolase, partial [Thermonemataceae bacterium]
FGAMITAPEAIEQLAEKIARSDYQMNTHAIGDSANSVVLRTYAKVLKNQPDRRWKIEHAQVVDPKDLSYFSNNILPSVQPTHATSDMHWVEERVGEKRLVGAYAYKSLLKEAGLVALGTDFPVEEVSPLLTFYAAVARKNLDNYPEDGFRAEEALSRAEALKGMTLWAAYSNFEEAEKGSLAIGKKADFVILGKDIMTIPLEEIPTVKVLKTYLDGQVLYGD